MTIRDFATWLSVQPETIPVGASAESPLIFEAAERYLATTNPESSATEGVEPVAGRLTNMFGTWIAENASPQQIDSYTAFYERVIEPFVASLYASPPNAEPAPTVKPWQPPSRSERPDGFECLIWHRGRWRHVIWNATHAGWQFDYGSAMTIDGIDRPFAPLPTNTPEHNFWEGERS